MRIFKSLTLIMIFVVGFYTVAAVMAHITGTMMAPIPGSFAAMYGGIVINLGCACNYFILFACRYALAWLGASKKSMTHRDSAISFPKISQN